MNSGEDRSATLLLRRDRDCDRHRLHHQRGRRQMKRRTRTGLVAHSRRDACIHNIWHDDADVVDADGIAAKSGAKKFLPFWENILLD